MKLLLTYLSVFIVLISAPLSLHAWGFWAHQRINRLAIFTLPPEMLALYKANIEYLTEHAVDPDKRRYAVDGEAARHFIDVDHYGVLPFPNVPRYWSDAKEKLTEDTLMAYGIVPYHIPRDLDRLTRAFRNKDVYSIMKISADIGHYIGDSHVPLHTTENYNGQLTGQKGIHGFWESRLPELFGEQYDFFVGRAYFIEDPALEAWQAVLEAHTALDSVLSFEKKLSETFPSDKKYGFESRNRVTVRNYSRDYSAAYHEMLGGMVERRMRMSIRRVGAFWYTAWKRAGSPDLSDLVDVKIKSKPRKYKRRLKINDREAQSIGLMQIHRFRQSPFNDPHACCMAPSSAFDKLDEELHHQYVVALIKERREREIAAIQRRKRISLWEQFWSYMN